MRAKRGVHAMNETETIARISFLNDSIKQIDEAFIKCMGLKQVISELNQLKQEYSFELKGLKGLCKECGWKM